jgi:2-phosphosulfolactate phosphatase
VKGTSVTGWEQPGFDPRLEWAAEGAALLARACPVLVVVDVLRFTTAVEVAVARGARVVPRRWPGGGAGGPGAGAVVLAGCLRNASAVAAAARRLGGPVGVVAAGERRPDGGLRPAVEDLVGAGAILHALGGRPSPEAQPARVAAEHDVSRVVPRLSGGGFAQLSWPG